jgi:hypothetical protein
MTKINHAARIERRLRRFLEKEGRARESYLYHQCTGPSYVWTKEQFSQLIAQLAEGNFCEIMSGPQRNSVWVVRKDYVDETMRSGVLL